MRNKKRIVFLSITIIVIGNMYSQDSLNNRIYYREQKLKRYFEQAYFSQTDLLKRQYNDSIISEFQDLLQHPETFNYGFDSLKRMGKIKSPDKVFKIYNWNLSYLNGTHEYFGFVQYYSKKEKEVKVFKLTDRSEEIENPEKHTFDPDYWYGMLYYEIIPMKYKRNKMYVLLALDLNNFLTTKRCIDVLYFDDAKNPKFGKEIFEFENKKYKRIIFEYSSNATMTLTYDESSKMIIFDHLSPSRPHLAGNYQFYGPDFSYDALVWEKGKWKHVLDVDVRNPK